MVGWTVLDYRTLVKRVAIRSNTTEAVVREVVGWLVVEVCETVARGMQARIPGLGKWKPVKKEVRATGEVGGICFRKVGWKVQWKSGEMMERALELLPVAYKKMRIKAGKRMEDILEVCHGTGRDGRGNGGARVEAGERLPQGSGGWEP